MSPRPMTPAAPAGLVAVLALTLCVGTNCRQSTQAPPATTLDRQALMDPKSCKNCHADHYRDWSGSMHAYAADDPVFLAMNRRGQRETDGALGKFCVNCHAPVAVREGATTDGLNLAEVPQALKGVTCFFCHSVDRVDGTHNNPLHVADDGVIRGAFTDPVPNNAHRAGYSTMLDRDQVDSARLCGACHDIVNEHGARLERTFDEWQKTVFSRVPDGATCGQCHMPRATNLRPIAQAPGVFSRLYHAHDFPAVDVALTPFAEAEAQKTSVQSFLDTSLQSAICVAPAAAGIQVVVDNVAAGHSWPSGSVQDRRAWFEVIAYAAGREIYKSGVVQDGSSVLKNPDPDLWLLRDCMFDALGKPVSMFWEAVDLESHLLPGKFTFDKQDPRFYQTHIVQTYPRQGVLPGVPDRVTLRVRLQPMGLDVLDELVGSGDLDPAVRARMTTMDIGKIVEWTPVSAVDGYVFAGAKFTCVTNTNINFAADRFPPPPTLRCP